ncbi:cob(I)yrinic acid a,c-diamide adenosyltransferase [Alkalibacter saccharofermentans]|uniref:Corrinoid adenosyltransferase n=1 Tax=Alkalibacter saccharofermentans DSM 14828 TaxID=1120975 RepID=A0A1M4SR97_9FIRM|nr:cob(I)yrinic acid a,c-diamide adenosyltransferase [Alkalibacter saccharofermentans]SHE34696.1 ATP:cob(I)alamin adenosyltransferase [Alkalibacter saccharofermentans DSM 14828]
MASVYTKTGDQGETGLLGGSRIGKDDLRVDCYGTLDEANAMIGVAYSMIQNKRIKEILEAIQQKIFLIGAELASDENGKKYLSEMIHQGDIEDIEKVIDKYSTRVGEQKYFITPGQTTESSFLHVARSIIRRAERLMVRLQRKDDVRKDILQYINRLSDLLFILARVESEILNKTLDNKPKIWRRKKIEYQNKCCERSFFRDCKKDGAGS